MLRAHIDDPAAADPLWRHLRDFAALGDGPLTDLCLFAEETGYVAAPGPFFPTAALFSPLLGALGHELLGPAVAGEVTGTVAVAGADGVWRANDDRVKTFVPGGRSRGLGRSGVERSGGDDSCSHRRFERVATVDFSRRMFEVEAGSDAAPAQSVDPEAFEAVLERATVALAAEMAGTARRLFDMALAYAKERVQFDVPIGSFQAIQHKLADVALDLERATSAVYYAAMAIDAEGRRPSSGDPRGQGGGRRRRHARGQGRHPDPRRHRVHVGARPAPVHPPRLRVRGVARHARLAPRPPRRAAVLIRRLVPPRLASASAMNG